MPHDRATDLGRLQQDLSDLLHALDPVRFSMEAADAARHAIARVRAFAASLAQKYAGTPVSHVEAKLWNALHALLGALPDPSALVRSAEFAALYREVRPIYDQLVDALRADVAVSAPKPHNALRSLVHIGIGLGAALAFETLLTPRLAMGLAAAWVVWAWSLEGARRASPGVNDWCMWFFGPIAREHEHKRINSATWFGTGILVASILWSPLPGVLGLIAAAVGDPAAGYVGRRWGHTKLYLGRSLEGSVAFAAAAFAVGAPFAAFFHGEVGVLACVAAAAAAAIVGAMVEHVSSTIDDNLAVTVLGGAAATVALWLV